MRSCLDVKAFHFLPFLLASPSYTIFTPINRWKYEGWDWNLRSIGYESVTQVNQVIMIPQVFSSPDLDLKGYEQPKL
ncbi:hypothetical protein NPIL_89671 [Nephila pilipes]|uniref:Uncharacterized protein n=1 Tax=Nephila pilipes TaxID=299642 RepID=A0A8X6N127_NEPPI|nr:hypothetical protein NPIL_89671 [Nephila pilipes]